MKRSYSLIILLLLPIFITGCFSEKNAPQIKETSLKPVATGLNQEEQSLIAPESMLDSPIELRLKYGLNYKPSGDGEYLIYQKGPYGKQIFLLKKDSSKPELIYDYTGDWMVLDEAFVTLWNGTNDGVYIILREGEGLKYSIYFYSLKTKKLERLPGEMFSGENYHNSNSVVAGFPGKETLLVQHVKPAGQNTDGSLKWTVNLVEMNNKGEIVQELTKGDWRTHYYFDDISGTNLLYRKTDPTVLEQAPEVHLLNLANGKDKVVGYGYAVFRPKHNTITLQDVTGPKIMLKEINIDDLTTKELYEIPGLESFTWNHTGTTIYFRDRKIVFPEK